MNKMQKFIAWLLIPRGMYCDGCPFHFIDKTLPKQMNGYCSYLGKSDVDFYNEQPDTLEIEQRQPDGTYKKRIVPKEEMFSMSLLWDGCKECGKKK